MQSPTPPQAGTEIPRAILVLGMHRSGTSAVAGTLRALGAAAPATLTPATDANPKGYWESARLMEVHNELLETVDSFWDDWRTIEPRAFEQYEAQQQLSIIGRVIGEEYANKHLFFLKDPRACRFVTPLRQVLQDLGHGVSAVLPLRNPIEVARSIHRRDGISPAKTVLVWLRHVFDAERDTRSMPRQFVRYDKFLEDWRTAVEAIARESAIEWPVPINIAAAEIEAFLQSGLRHEVVEITPSAAEATTLEERTYREFCELIENGDSTEVRSRIDRLRDEFDQACDVFDNALMAENSAGARHQRQSLAARIREIETLQRNLSGAVVARDEMAAQLKETVVERDNLLDHRDQLTAQLAKLSNELVQSHEARERLAAQLREAIDERDQLLDHRARLSSQLEAALATQSNSVKPSAP